MLSVKNKHQHTIPN